MVWAGVGPAPHPGGMGMIVLLVGTALVWIVAAVFGTDSREGRDWQWNAPTRACEEPAFTGRRVSLRRGRPTARCSQ